MDKSKFLDTNGNPLTQALFLEFGYRTEYAIYTLKEFDHEYKGVKYPSIRRLYLEMEDLTEYDFATEYFLSWSHWKRLTSNAMIAKHIEEWREELEVKIRAQAIRDIINITAENAQGSFQAAKWLADRGWDKRAAGRPSKEEKDKRAAIEDRMADEFKADIIRLETAKQ